MILDEILHRRTNIEETRIIRLGNKTPPPLSALLCHSYNCS